MTTANVEVEKCALKFKMHVSNIKYVCNIVQPEDDYKLFISV